MKRAGWAIIGCAVASAAAIGAYSASADREERSEPATHAA
jgi:hypothetical protein